MNTHRANGGIAREIELDSDPIWLEVKGLSDVELRTFLALYFRAVNGRDSKEDLSNSQLAYWDSCKLNTIHKRLCRIRKKAPALLDLLPSETKD